MKRFGYAALLALALALTACASPVTPAAPTPTTLPATVTEPAAHMEHRAQHGGQLGMSENIHIEIVSERPGEYKVYLSDAAGRPLPLEGARLEVALIDTSGNELLVMPARLADDAEYFIAQGGPTDVMQLDVRVRVIMSGSASPVANATVRLLVTGGMSGMEGEHDEEFRVAVPSQTPGLYVVQAALGASDLVTTGITVEIQRDAESWAFVIPADELSPR